METGYAKGDVGTSLFIDQSNKTLLLLSGTSCISFSYVAQNVLGTAYDGFDYVVFTFLKSSWLAH